METLVVKLLQKYFQLFISNFHKDNFSLSVLKGTGSLSNLRTVVEELTASRIKYTGFARVTRYPNNDGSSKRFLQSVGSASTSFNCFYSSL